MIQGGAPAGTGMGGPGYRFEDECPPGGPAFDRPGLLAMANAGPHTNGSQFFVTVVPTPWLTGKHTIFGEVVEGYDVVEAISGVATGAQDHPTTDVVLERVHGSEDRPTEVALRARAGSRSYEGCRHKAPIGSAASR